MRHLTKVLATAGLLAGALVLGTTQPAAAVDGIVLSSSGTIVTATVTGPADVSPHCGGGTVLVNGVAPSPAVACSALTKLTVNGDGARQVVRGGQLGNPPFTSSPTLTVNLGAGNDTVFDTLRADTLNLGTGADGVLVDTTGVANLTVDLGPDADVLYLSGLPTADTMNAQASGSTVTVGVDNAAGLHTYSATNAEGVSLLGYGGNDQLYSVAIPAASAIDDIRLDGGNGNDVLLGGPDGTQFLGGAGTNTMTGSIGPDQFFTTSSTDSIDTGTGANTIQDEGLRTGGRSIAANTGSNTYVNHSRGGDTVVRVRAGATAGTSQVTVSLSHTGQQQLPSSMQRIDTYVGDASEPSSRNVLDVVAIEGVPVHVNGDVYVDDLADITIPEGSWSTSGTPGTASYVVIPDGTHGYSAVFPGTVPEANIRIHGPWTDKARGFAHRVTRDLMHRFGTTAAIDNIRARLTRATNPTTRAQEVAVLMGTDEYRGLDVDRTFLKFLRRASDPGGRTYWINSIRNGKSLIKFRAQLFGSNEYFTKAGATNEAYVEKAYADVLGRAPDPSGKAYWTNKINDGADRGAVALQFLASAEARRNIVKDQFLRFLDRLPTTAETDTWVATLGSSNPTSEQTLVAFLAASGSYYGRT